MDNANRNIARLYKEKLNMLLDVAQTINEDHTIEDLMVEFETLLREDLGIGKILVFTLDNGVWSNILASGVSDEVINSINVERDLLPYRDIANITLSGETIFAGIDAIIPLYHKFRPIGFVLVGDDEMGDGLSPTLRNLKYIQILSNIIIVFIENKKMQQKLLRQESLRSELKVAKQIQSRLVPSNDDLLKTTHTEVRSLYQPHHEVGGDYFDVLRLSPYSIGFCMADVSGKGIAAALLMSNFQALVRAHFTARISMRQLVKELNQKVNQNSANDKFITLFIARYNMITGTLSYVNAGHLPPIVYDKSANEMTQLERGCIGLGMLDEIPGIDVGHIAIHRGTRIIAFTDGLVEIDEGHRVKSSMERIKNTLRTTSDITETMDEIKKIVEQDRAGGLTFDDVSVLGVEFVKRGLLSIK